MERRDAIKWMLAAAGSAFLLERRGLARGGPGPAPAGVGEGSDPNLLKDYHPGDLWPLSFSPAQRRSATALCDVILPADAQSPSASAVGVPAFIDEWISAPYAWIGSESGPGSDREVILGGLDWIDGEAQRRFATDFAGLIHSQQTAICDPICHEPAAEPERKDAAKFFNRFRELTLGGFYTTKEGMLDLKYIGNVAQSTFTGPPPEALRQVGLL
jgi:hypothetical protein